MKKEKITFFYEHKDPKKKGIILTGTVIFSTMEEMKSKIFL